MSTDIFLSLRKKKYIYRVNKSGLTRWTGLTRSQVAAAKKKIFRQIIAKWWLQNSYMAKETFTDKASQKAQGIYNPLGKRLYTLKEAAEYLGRSVWGVRDLIWARVIPVVKQQGCRKMYLDITDLNAFIEKNKAIYN